METVRERALSFLHDQLRWVETFAEDYPPGTPWPERDGRVAGAVGALLAAGAIDAAEADVWRARLNGEPEAIPVADEALRARAAAVLEELLAAVPAQDAAGFDDAHEAFESAVGAL